MQELSINAKQKIIEKVLAKDGRTVKEIAKCHNVGLSTLGRWVRNYRNNAIIGNKKSTETNQNLSMSDRFQHLMATASLEETELGIYCREKGIYSFQLTEWKEAFMAQKSTEQQRSNITELKALRAENKKLKQEIRRKDSALAETTALLILKKKAGLIWGGKRGRLINAIERHHTIELITEACKAGSRKRQACELVGLSVRTLERWEKEDGLQDQRKTVKRVPNNKLTKEQRDMVIMTANNTIYRDLPPCKIVPLLADEGIYIASESTFYRILREENQIVNRQTSRPAKHHRPETYEATSPNQVWTWDISYLPTKVVGLYFYLYMIVDIYSRKIVGFSVHEQELSEYAAYLITQACLDEGISEEQLVLHSDNGSPMKGATMLATLEKLGVIPSFSRPSVSDDNPYSEALFRTVKYHPSFPMLDKFSTIQNARIWCEKFVFWYNNVHLHSSLKFVTPQQRHSRQDTLIRENRHQVYQIAKAQYPARWSGQTRNWSLSNSVTLNPKKKDKLTSPSSNNAGNVTNGRSKIKLSEQERLDGAGEGSRQAADAARQYGYARLIQEI